MFLFCSRVRFCRQRHQVGSIIRIGNIVVRDTLVDLADGHVQSTGLQRHTRVILNIDITVIRTFCSTGGVVDRNRLRVVFIAVSKLCRTNREFRIRALYADWIVRIADSKRLRCTNRIRICRKRQRVIRDVAIFALRIAQRSKIITIPSACDYLYRLRVDITAQTDTCIGYRLIDIICLVRFGVQLRTRSVSATIELNIHTEKIHIQQACFDTTQ